MKIDRNLTRAQYKWAKEYRNEQVQQYASPKNFKKWGTSSVRFENLFARATWKQKKHIMNML